MDNAGPRPPRCMPPTDQLRAITTASGMARTVRAALTFRWNLPLRLHGETGRLDTSRAIVQGGELADTGSSPQIAANFNSDGRLPSLRGAVAADPHIPSTEAAISLLQVPRVRQEFCLRSRCAGNVGNQPAYRRRRAGVAPRRPTVHAAPRHPEQRPDRAVTVYITTIAGGEGMVRIDRRGTTPA
jgi:hypothetical protein